MKLILYGLEFEDDGAQLKYISYITNGFRLHTCRLNIVKLPINYRLHNALALLLATLLN